MKLMRYRRRIALQESKALRLLANAHGRIPKCAPTDWRPIYEWRNG